LRGTRSSVVGHDELDKPLDRYFGAAPDQAPYDLLLAALGACISMTMRMYADRKGWQLERVRITLRHSRIHANDCADCETSSGWIDHIDRW
jgi:putative redox protein